MWLLSVITALAVHITPIWAALTAPVQTENGLVQGVAGTQYESVTVFRGIPYAAPPVGQFRFAPPQDAPNWDGTRDGSQFGDVCPTQPMGDEPSRNNYTASEDCLNLNIWTAANDSSEMRPVYFWIHGGGGTNQDPNFDGEGLAQKGLVVVVINYRVDVFGFLAHPELSDESGYNASGNYGLMDQIAALGWVQRNIGAFGADPSKVTIGGQSAGAAYTLHLLNCPLAKGLFRAAVAESGARHPRDPELVTLAEGYTNIVTAEQRGVNFAAYVNTSSLADLRDMNASDLLSGSGDTGWNYFEPVLDGHVIEMSYSDAILNGYYNDVPIITGNNRDESGASVDQNITLQDYRVQSAGKYGTMIRRFLELYPASDDSEAADSLNQSYQDNSRVGTYLWALLWATKSTSPTWTYYWTHAPPGQNNGAFHGSEINYFFNNLYGTDFPWAEEDYQIADVLSDYLVNFVTNLDPNCRGVPAWDRTNIISPVTMELGDNSYGPIYVSDTAARLMFFEKFFPTQEAH